MVNRATKILGVDDPPGFPKTSVMINISAVPSLAPELGISEMHAISPGKETKQVLAHCLKFMEIAKKEFPGHRSEELLVIDSDGKSRILSRFLSPLEPPAEITDAAAAANYVAAFPNFQDLQISENSVQLDCQEFLQLRAGGKNVHAILLCNFLNFLDG